MISEIRHTGKRKRRAREDDVGYLRLVATDKYESKTGNCLRFWRKLKQ